MYPKIIPSIISDEKTPRESLTIIRNNTFSAFLKVALDIIVNAARGKKETGSVNTRQEEKNLSNCKWYNCLPEQKKSNEMKRIKWKPIQNNVSSLG